MAAAQYSFRFVVLIILLGWRSPSLFQQFPPRYCGNYEHFFGIVLLIHNQPIHAPLLVGAGIIIYDIATI